MAGDTLKTVAATIEPDGRYRIEVGRHSFLSAVPVDDGGCDSAPTPAELLPAALAGCVAHSVAAFLLFRDLPTEGVEVAVDAGLAMDPPRVDRFDVRLRLPRNVPQKYRKAIERAADICLVRHTLADPPAFNLTVE